MALAALLLVLVGEAASVVESEADAVAEPVLDTVTELVDDIDVDAEVEPVMELVTELVGVADGMPRRITAESRTGGRPLEEPLLATVRFQVYPVSSGGEKATVSCASIWQEGATRASSTARVIVMSGAGRMAQLGQLPLTLTV